MTSCWLLLEFQRQAHDLHRPPVNWKLLVIKKALMGRIPFGDALRRWKRRTLGYQPNASNLQNTLDNYCEMTAALEAAGRGWSDATVLEIGSGWFPVIPILMCLDGAREVLMSDLNPHMDEVTFRSAVNYLRQRFPQREALRGIERLEQLPIRYLAPFAPTSVRDESVDLVVSRTVLEHIPPTDMEQLFKALRNKLKPGGLMVHLIDHSDHLEHQDRSISRINFLTWSAAFHRRVNVLIKEGENRLRHHEYRPLFERAGYRVLAETAPVDEATLRRCQGLALVSPYDRMTPEQLSVMTSVYVVSAVS